MKGSSLSKLLRFLMDLENAKIFFSLKNSRPDAITVMVSVPGERWEVDFFADRPVEVERFINQTGEITGPETLKELFERFSD